jgi:hypothetical protein
LLASVDEGGIVRLWDARHCRALRVFTPPEKSKELEKVFFSPDGRLLAAVGQQGAVHVFEVRTGKHIRDLALPKPKPDEVFFALPLAGIFVPSENLFLLAQEGRLLAWNLLTGREDGRFQQIAQQPIKVTPHGACLISSPDGRFIFRGDGGGWLYEAASGRITHRFPGFYTTAIFHPSLPRLAAVDEKRLGVLIYDLRTLFRLLPTRSNQPTLQQLWDDLADRDANRAYGAVGRLADAPGLAAFFAGKLTPIARPEPSSLEKHIANLASDDFAMRQKVEQALAEAADTARPSLQKALRTATDVEQRMRLKRLLNLLDPPSGDTLRQHRAILALEQRGTPQARQLLQKLAAGAPDARLTREAKAALQRLASRP